MAEIPNDMIQSLRAALNGLGKAPLGVTDPVRDTLGAEVAMALDDLLAASFELVEAANGIPLDRAS
ncbi:hypothetical protein [Paracoccus laeviglucosivorans]|uniref:Uncharacterized protein n=1 Tax=Paracoccus laeviglucosivorans TaxID=1197861 RepID=A0A521BDG4_9RHOB|nr:hypothetical protein [Paracoccus laeviglucosivorans]SMO45021.1 hypothetical protein SAMN06265221_102239 [Paracoccus laeviglucosivorans]